MCEILCKWLPELILFEDFKEWHKYENYLYKIFKRDFILDKPYFKDKPVNIRKHPMECDKEQAFFHITTVDRDHKGSNDPNDRIPDLRRCERIKWPRKIIEEYDCQDVCDWCDKIKTWKQPHKSYLRLHFLFEEYRYLVVLEERKKFMLLVTAFYIERDHELRKILKRYSKYREKYSW